MRKQQPTSACEHGDIASIAQRHALAEGTIHRLQALCAEFKGTPEKARGRRPKTEQRDAMRGIRDQARELKRLLDDLPNGECMGLDRQLRVLGVPEAEHAEPLFAAATTAHRTLCSLAVAAERELTKLKETGMHGRRQTQGFSVSLVTFVAIALKDEGIAPSRSRRADGTAGAFLGVCKACFDAAGISADPDGAIQAFLSGSHAELKERGFCL